MPCIGDNVTVEGECQGVIVALEGDKFIVDIGGELATLDHDSISEPQEPHGTPRMAMATLPGVYVAWLVTCISHG